MGPRPLPQLSTKKRSTSSPLFKEKGGGVRARLGDKALAGHVRALLGHSQHAAGQESSGGIIFRGCKPGIWPGRKVSPSRPSQPR